MPRIRLLRLILLLPILCYLTLIALWAFLPSFPSVHGGNYSHYHQDVLRAGKRLTTAYEASNRYYSPRNEDNHERSWFAVDWQLVKDPEHDSITLRIGEDAGINLTSLASVTDTTVSGLVTVTAKSGDLDGVMMPWFAPADACLLNWEIEHGPKIIDIRALVTEPGVIQIWPESTRWTNEPLNLPSPYSDFQPFLTISNVPVQGDKTDLSQIEIEQVTWSLPTKTFAIRRSILHLLKPITLVLAPVLINWVLLPLQWIFFSLCVLISTFVWIPLLGGIVTFLCWLAAGRPTYEPWARKFLLTRWLYKAPERRAIWGPGGLITYVEDEGGLEDGDPTRVGRIGTLETPLDFFRSRAPLDDLLNTFERTRWMTRPIQSSRTRPRNRFESDEDATIYITQAGKV